MKAMKQIANESFCTTKINTYFVITMRKLNIGIQNMIDGEVCVDERSAKEKCGQSDGGGGAASTHVAKGGR